VLILERIVQIEQFRVMQLVHNVDLVFDSALVQRIRSVDELGDEVSSGRLLDGSVHHAESTTVNAVTISTQLSKSPNNTSLYQVHIGRIFTIMLL